MAIYFILILLDNANNKLWDGNSPKWLAVATVSIKGEEQDIIPAFTDYSIKQKDFSKDKVFTAMDKSKILPTIFCLTDAEVFIKENVKLFDYHGREIDELLKEHHEY